MHFPKRCPCCTLMPDALRTAAIFECCNYSSSKCKDGKAYSVSDIRLVFSLRTTTFWQSRSAPTSLAPGTTGSWTTLTLSSAKTPDAAKRPVARGTVRPPLYHKIIRGVGQTSRAQPKCTYPNVVRAVRECRTLCELQRSLNAAVSLPLSVRMAWYTQRLIFAWCFPCALRPFGSRCLLYTSPSPRD